MENKILLVGGSRDGEWIEDPKLPRYHVILQELKSAYEDDSKAFSPYRTEVYIRRTSYLISGDKIEMYVPEEISNYQALIMLLKHYNPKPSAAEPPKPQPEDPDIAKRKAEDRLAAMAWNAFMSTPIPKQK